MHLRIERELKMASNPREGDSLVFEIPVSSKTEARVPWQFHAHLYHQEYGCIQFASSLPDDACLIHSSNKTLVLCASDRFLYLLWLALWRHSPGFNALPLHPKGADKTDT